MCLKSIVLPRVLANIFLNACPKLQLQNSYPSKFSYSSTSNLYSNNILIFISLLCHKGKYTLQSCSRKKCLLQKYLVFTPKSQNWKFFSEIFFMSKESFQETACSGNCLSWLRSHQDRVLARISEMPVQNSNFKISARPDLATYLFQSLKSATFNSQVCQKGQFTLQLCPGRWFVRKIFGYCTPKVKIEKSS